MRLGYTFKHLMRKMAAFKPDIIGVTLVYETPEMADEITIDWRLFSETVRKIEATTSEGNLLFFLPAAISSQPSVFCSMPSTY